jgi:hypothetical protein
MKVAELHVRNALDRRETVTEENAAGINFQASRANAGHSVDRDSYQFSGKSG